MINTLKPQTLICLFLALCCAFSLNGQPGSSGSGGIKTLSDAELAQANQDAQRYLERLERYIETKQGAGVGRRFCRAYGKIGLDCIDYPAVYVNDKLQIIKKQMRLDEYFIFLEERAKNKVALTNSCISISSGVEMASSGTSSPIGQLQGKMPNLPDRADFTVPKGSYYIYQGTAYIKETIVMFRENQIIREEFFNEVKFESRYIAKPGGDGEFGWVTYMSSINRINSRKGQKNARKTIGKDSDPCDVNDCVEDFSYTPIPFKTYLMPGVGWRNFNPQRKFNPLPAVVTGVVCIGAGYAVFSKLESDRFYDAHLEGRVIELKRNNYVRANNNNQRFIVASGVAALFWLTSDAWIFLKDRRNARIFKKRFSCPPGLSGSIPRPDYSKPVTIGPTALPDAVGGVGLRLTVPISY